jgi:hypothetical protein
MDISLDRCRGAGPELDENLTGNELRTGRVLRRRMRREHNGDEREDYQGMAAMHHASLSVQGSRGASQFRCLARRRRKPRHGSDLRFLIAGVWTDGVTDIDDGARNGKPCDYGTLKSPFAGGVTALSCDRGTCASHEYGMR